MPSHFAKDQSSLAFYSSTSTTTPNKMPTDRSRIPHRHILHHHQRMLQRLLHISMLIFGFFVLEHLPTLSSAEMCRKMTPNKQLEVFQCPRLFETKAKSWCCGSNTFESHCCEWEQRAKEAGLLSQPTPFSQFLLTTGAVLLVGLIICFLCCNPSTRIRSKDVSRWWTRRNQGAAPHNGHAHGNGHLEPGAPLPPVPPYTEYPEEQPPPYHQVINGTTNGNGLPPSAPPPSGPDPASALPLLTSEQKDIEANQTNPNPHPPPQYQPPYNPSYP